MSYANLVAGDKIEGGGQGDDNGGGNSLCEEPPAYQSSAGGSAPGRQSMRDFPITLPSLQVAVLRVPVPMTTLDYDTLTAMLAAYKPALVPSSDKPADDDHDEDESPKGE